MITIFGSSFQAQRLCLQSQAGSLRLGEPDERVRDTCHNIPLAQPHVMGASCRVQVTLVSIPARSCKTAVLVPITIARAA